MNEKLWQKIIDISAVVSDDSLSQKMYELILEVANVTHFGVFVFNSDHMNDPELVFYGGDISDYWMKVYALNDRHATLTKNVVFDKNLENISIDKMVGDMFYQFEPETSAKSEILKIYQDSGTCEKLYLLHISNKKLYQFNVYRSAQLGPFTDIENIKLRKLLPFLINLVKLRIQICGAGNYQRRSRKAVISNLRKQDVPLFNFLSKREAEVCDLIIFGLTTEGIAEELSVSVSSVKTFRNRAYRKLNIFSKSELFVMIMNNQEK